MALVLAACAGGGSNGDGPAGDIDPNGELKAAFSLPPMPLDPHRATSDVAQFTYASLVYDRLTQIEPGPEVKPLLAESWEFAEDGLSVDFLVREGATFSDGAAVDAEAVKLSLDRAVFDPESTVAFRFPMIESIEVVDPMTVRITTNRPASDLPYLLAATSASIVSPNALNNPDLDVKPVGSGPYVLTELTLGESATFERRDDYWNPDGALAKTINIVGIADNNARLNALRSGQVDFILTNAAQADEVKNLGPDYQVFSYPPGAAYSLFLNYEVPPLDNVEVRRALNHAINREAITSNLLNGYCEPLNQPLPSGVAGHVEDPPYDYEYDPDLARTMLADAGYPDGFSLKLLASAGLSPQDAIAVALQDQFKEIGVTLEIDQKDPAQAPALYGEGDYGAFVQTRVAGATPLLTLLSNFSTSRVFLGQTPQEFKDALSGATDPNLPPEEYESLLQDASAIANEQAFDGFICANQSLLATTKRIIGYDEMGVGYYTNVYDFRKVGVLSDS
ncbi:ABC transporter substrate-binding protein [Aeromicrobium sp.]|uniref:ABC transporter substrate-binding protein n=1 Tax=Aeromicrobium sp. TaxID=1871063 RepID=UPI0025C40C19|nr:ABC transporter substrate-binding protein [Aeromicrobium sp.]MCK5890297.1 ABC transporter substrate-binding protein [Aeromicrobium sp.]